MRMTSGLIVALALAGFANVSANAAERTYIIGTSPQGSLAFSSGNAISKIASDKNIGVTLRARATGGSATVVPQINNGQIDFGLSNALECGEAYVGKGMFEGKPQANFRLAAAIYPLQTGFAVAGESRIRSLADAKGMRIPSEFTTQSTFVQLTRAALGTANLKPEDFVGMPTPDYIKGGDMLAQGKVDMAMVAPGSGASRKQAADLKNRGGLRFVSLGPNVAAMRAVFPEAYPFTRAADKSIPGLEQGATLMAYPFYLTTGAHVPEEVIYKVVKVIHENKQPLTQAFGSFRDLDTKDMARPHSTVKYHPGAVRYYKEKGIWQNGLM